MSDLLAIYGTSEAVYTPLNGEGCRHTFSLRTDLWRMFEVDSGTDRTPVRCSVGRIRNRATLLSCECEMAVERLLLLKATGSSLC